MLKTLQAVNTLSFLLISLYYLFPGKSVGWMVFYLLLAVLHALFLLSATKREPTLEKYKGKTNNILYNLQSGEYRPDCKYFNLDDMLSSFILISDSDCVLCSIHPIEPGCSVVHSSSKFAELSGS